MTILNVPDMRCKNCVNRITSALNSAELEFSISLHEKTVSIDGDEKAVNTAISELEDLGFEVKMQ